MNRKQELIVLMEHQLKGIQNTIENNMYRSPIITLSEEILVKSNILKIYLDELKQLNLQ